MDIATKKLSNSFYSSLLNAKRDERVKERSHQKKNDILYFIIFGMVNSGCFCCYFDPTETENIFKTNKKKKCKLSIWNYNKLILKKGRKY
jgi:hypothetical protein